MVRRNRASRTCPRRSSGAAVGVRACLALSLASVAVFGAATAPAGAAAAPRTLRAKVTAELRLVPRLARNLGRKVSRESARRSRRQAALALRLARRGRLCGVLDALSRIDHVGRVGSRLVAAERLLRRARIARRCRDRGRRGASKRARTVSGGTPGSGVEKPHPPENEQGGEEDFPPTPIGARRPRKGGRGAPTDVKGTAPVAASSAARGLPAALTSRVTDPIAIFRRTSIGKPNTKLSPLDPSSATAGNIVLVSGNLYLAVSTDGGRTFTYRRPVDIYSTSDPASLKNPDGGACCDQVVHYDQTTNRFYWLLQYWCTVQSDCKKRPGENRLRLAVASPQEVAESGGTRWRFWDITSRDVGLKGQWLDFPDLAVGRQFLYLTVNSPSAGSAIWARFRKRSLARGTLDWRYHRYAGEYILKPVQNTRDVGFAVRRSSTTELELKRWNERGATTSTSSDKIPIGTTPTQGCRAASPDGNDFLEFQGCGGFSASVAGAAMEGSGGDGNGRIWVGWTSGTREEGTKYRDGTDKLDGAKTFPQPHVELAILDPNRGSLVEQQAIWNNAYAYSYPYLASGPSGEVVMTYMAGGGGKQYPGWGVGYLTNRRSFARVADGTVGSTRVGDYLAVRPAWPSRKLFAATGNVLDASGYLPYYALFGRSGDGLLQGPPTPGVPPVVTLPRPDLVVTALTKTDVTVQNVGNGNAGLFYVNVSYNGPGGPGVDRHDVPSLAAGAVFRWKLPCRTGPRTATADADGQVTESDEANNTKTIDVPSCP